MSENGVREPAQAQPPRVKRFRWVKRMGLAVGLIFAGLAGLRCWWGWEASKRLQAEIDRCRASGEPMSASDFDTTPVPEEQNAIRVLKEAVAAGNLTAEQAEL